MALQRLDPFDGEQRTGWLVFGRAGTGKTRYAMLREERMCVSDETGRYVPITTLLGGREVKLLPGGRRIDPLNPGDGSRGTVRGTG